MRGQAKFREIGVSLFNLLFFFLRNTHGIVLVSAEYNATIPPALTNLLDHFPPASYRHKPCSIVTYSLGMHFFF